MRVRFMFFVAIAMLFLISLAVSEAVVAAPSYLPITAQSGEIDPAPVPPQEGLEFLVGGLIFTPSIVLAAALFRKYLDPNGTIAIARVTLVIAGVVYAIYAFTYVAGLQEQFAVVFMHVNNAALLIGGWFGVQFTATVLQNVSAAQSVKFWGDGRAQDVARIRHQKLE